MSKPPAIVVENLRQGYGRKSVLNDVSLSVPAGQTFALLGRNGAGKTTLIRTLLGVLPPAAGSGRLEVLGMRPSEQPIEVRGRVGYLAEDQTIYPWMTADEVAQFLAPFYPTWNVALASSLLDRFGVPRDVRIRQLSKGHNIRLGLALALAHRPQLVILDDPALGLDPISRKQFNRDVIEHLQGEGRTVFYSSHLLYEVEPLADVVAILDAGRMVRVSPVEELQRDVKRVILSAETLAQCPRPEKLLDVARDGARWLVVVDAAENWIAGLHAAGCEAVVEDLSLDEIFEAFVIGRPEWPAAAGSAQTAPVH
jgi:ABC-2 type transport system ATP-binding protein